MTAKAPRPCPKDARKPPAPPPPPRQSGKPPWICPRCAFICMTIGEILAHTAGHMAATMNKDKP